MNVTDQSVFPVSSGLLPTGSPRAMRKLLPLSAGPTVEFDLFQETAKGEINNIQAIYIDNSLNGSPITIEVSGAQEKITLPPQSQGICPLFASSEPRLKITSAGGVDIPIHLLNVPLPFAVWSCAAISVSVAVPSGTYTDRSGSIAVGGTSQQLAAANANRKQLIVHNPPTAVENIYINFGAAATVAGGDSFCIVPGGYWSSGAGPITTQQVNVIASTNATKYIAKEM